MQQQVRQLTLTIKPQGGTTDRIISITSELSGVAGAWNFDTNQPVGNPATVKLVFTKQNDGTWQATVWLLGVTGTEQKLTTTLSFTGGTPGDLTETSDLSAVLTGFNSDKKTPLTLSATVVETQTGAGFTATINDWTKINGGTGTAN